MIVTFFEVEVSAWSNSKFCAYACERWHIMVIIIINYLSGWKLGHLEELIPSEFHSSQKESFWLRSRCETSEMPWSVLDLIENFTRYSTTCSCAPYCEVELLRPVAYIWPSEPSLWFCTWGVLCEYSSEFYIEVLIWGNKDLNLFIQAADRILIKWNCGKPPPTSFFPMWLAP